ncbi:hypothetical protein H6786_03150 [Candidatus Nomurabacteria bacterium]|nr:hypothetical protein [Candidatus Nomurabacteria bacterium]
MSITTVPKLFDVVNIVAQTTDLIRDNFRNHNHSPHQLRCMIDAALQDWATNQDLGYISSQSSSYSGQDYVLCTEPLESADKYVYGFAEATTIACIMERAGDKWLPQVAVIHDALHQWTWATSTATLPRTNIWHKGYHPSSFAPHQVQAPYRVQLSEDPFSLFDLHGLEQSLRSNGDLVTMSDNTPGLVGGLIRLGTVHGNVYTGDNACIPAASGLILRDTSAVITDLDGQPIDGFELCLDGNSASLLVRNGMIIAANHQVSTAIQQTIAGQF